MNPQLAYLSGERNENRLTDLAFLERHPEMKSRKIRPDEKDLALEWFRIRDSVIRPLLRKSTTTPGTATQKDTLATSTAKPACASACADDRCTSTYIRWMQMSLNQIIGTRLNPNGKLDDPTINAIVRFKSSRRLKTKEYYAGPEIERALMDAGAAPPPPLAKIPYGVSSANELVPLLEKHRGDIPVEVLLAWMDVESGRQLGSHTSICERGYFQLHPEESISLGLNHDLVGSNAQYSIIAGIRLVNQYRQRVNRLRPYGIIPGSDTYWRLVKLCHWIPSAGEKMLASMQKQGVAVTDWTGISNFARTHAQPLAVNIKRNPIDGINSVDRMFVRVAAWRKMLNH